VLEAPAHSVAGEAVAVTDVGEGFTETVTDADCEHPLELVPMTVYVVVSPGLTVMLAVVAPVFH
jgi:hypothetical protein